MHSTLQLLVDFVYTFRNFVNIISAKNETSPFTRVIFSPLIMGLIYTIQYLKYTADHIIVKTMTFSKCDMIFLITL